MLTKLSKDGWAYKNETKPDEFQADLNPDVYNLEHDLHKININQVCLKEMTQLKRIITETGAGYENVYATLNKDIEMAIKKSA